MSILPMPPQGDKEPSRLNPAGIICDAGYVNIQITPYPAYGHAVYEFSKSHTHPGICAFKSPLNNESSIPNSQMSGLPRRLEFHGYRIHPLEGRPGLGALGDRQPGPRQGYPDAQFPAPLEDLSHPHPFEIRQQSIQKTLCNLLDFRGRDPFIGMLRSSLG